MSTTYSPHPAAPARRFTPITPGPGALPFETRSVYVGVAGHIVAVDEVTGEEVSFLNVPAGKELPIITRHILAVGTQLSPPPTTTATALVAMD